MEKSLDISMQGLLLLSLKKLRNMCKILTIEQGSQDEMVKDVSDVLLDIFEDEDMLSTL